MYRVLLTTTEGETSWSAGSDEELTRLLEDSRKHFENLVSVQILEHVKPRGRPAFWELLWQMSVTAQGRQKAALMRLKAMI